MGADDQIAFEQVFRGLHRRGVPGERETDLAGEAADPVELVEIEAHRAGIDQLGEQHAALDEREGGAVARRGVENVIGRGEAAGRRLVLYDDGRIAGDEPAEVARHQPRQLIVAAAHGRAADDGNLFAGEKIVCPRGRGEGGRGCRDKRCRHRTRASLPQHFSLPAPGHAASAAVHRLFELVGDLVDAGLGAGFVFLAAWRT